MKPLLYSVFTLILGASLANAQSPILWYDFEDGQNPTANLGTLGSAYDGELQGGAILQVVGGDGALSLAGQPLAAVLPGPGQPQDVFNFGAQSYSIVARASTINSEPGDIGFRAIAWKQSIGGCDPTPFALGIRKGSGFAVAALSNGTCSVALNGCTPLNDGIPHELMFIRTQEAQYLVVDGVVEDMELLSPSFGMGGESDSALALSIGNRVAGSSTGFGDDTFRGEILDVQIYDEALAIPPLGLETLYGVTARAGTGTSQLVTVDQHSGLAVEIFEFDVAPEADPWMLSYHEPTGRFLMTLLRDGTTGAQATDWLFGILDPATGQLVTMDFSGLPVANIEGLAYDAESDRILVTVGVGSPATTAIAEVTISGEITTISPDLGLGDRDYAAWNSCTGLLLADFNSGGDVSRVDDPFGSPGSTVVQSLPLSPDFHELAVDDFSRIYTTGFTDGTLYRVTLGDFDPVGGFGTAQPVRGITFAESIVEEFTRGDCNQNASLDISDPVGLLGDLFRGGTPSTCDKACDANDDGARDIGDVVFLLSFLFDGGVHPTDPFDSCGSDPTPDPLTCQSFAACP